MDDDSPKPPRYVFTLVHGTFARRTAWIQDGSPLRTFLAERLGAGSVHYERFLWTGFNTDKARLRAASHLRRFLGERLAEHPEARHFVIAHSHGGNVVLHALHGLDDPRRVAGAVCFATPFIHCQARDVARSVRSLFNAALVAWTFLAYLLYALAGSFLATAAVWLVGSLALARRVFHRDGPVMAWARRRQEEVLRQFQPTAGLATPFLCIHPHFDEAGGVLGLAGAVSEAPYWLDRILEIFESLARWAFRLIVVVGVACALIATFHTGWFERGMDLNGVDVAVAACVVLAVLAALARLGLKLVRGSAEVAKLALPAGLRRMAFGSTGMTAYWLARFWTQPGPFGVATLVVRPHSIPVPFFAWRRQLRHTRIYQDPAVLADVAAWLLASAPAPPVEPAPVPAESTDVGGLAAPALTALPAASVMPAPGATGQAPRFGE